MNTKLLLGAVIGIVILGGIVAYPTIGNPNVDRFKLNSFSLSDDPNAIPDRLCFAKITTFQLVGGELFEVDHSPFAIGNPTIAFSFLAQDAVNELSGFEIRPKILCFNVDVSTGIDSSLSTEEKQAILDERVQACIEDKDGELCTQSNSQVMVFDPSELQIKVIGEDIPLDKHVTSYVKTIVTDEVEASDGQEVTLAKFRIAIEDLEDDLSPGQYTSWQEFRISGDLKMHPKVCSSCEYSYHIDDSKEFASFHQIIVLKETGVANVDTDGDGVADSNASGLQNDALEKEEEDRETEKKSGTDSLTDIVEFSDCLITQDEECLNQGKFAMYWFVLVALGGLIVLGILIAMVNSFRGNRQ